MEETAPESESEFDAKSDKNVHFPQIRGDKKMKDLRLALFNDLQNDGLVDRKVPFSTVRKSKQAKSPIAGMTRITTDDI